MRRRSVAVLLSLLFAGCSFFSRSKSRIYSLERVPPAAAAPAATASAAVVRGLPIAIDGIELPPGFDRKEIVVRQADHRLDVRSNEQWSASFQPAVLHMLAFDLAARLPEGMVILPGQVKPGGAMRSIDVVFEEIAAGPETRVSIDARWTLHESGRPAVAHHEQLAVDIPSLDSANVATGTSQALAALADRMASQITP